MVYNVTPQPSKAAVLVISQIGDHAVTLTLTLTSTLMREDPTPEQLAGEPSALACLLPQGWLLVLAGGR